jgi:hypothetical protein
MVCRNRVLHTYVLRLVLLCLLHLVRMQSGVQLSPPPLIGT